MNASDEINELAAALAKARGEFPAIPKHRTATVVMKSGGKYSYSYADISDVLDAITPALSKHGLCVTQHTVLDKLDMNLETWLIHSSGQYIWSIYPVCSIASDHKMMGAALTYARRFSLTAVVGVAADDDGDGENAARVEREVPMPHIPERAPSEPAVSSAAIDMGRRVLNLSTQAELDDLKATPEFKAFWSRANSVDRASVTNAVESFKAGLDAPVERDDSILAAG
jgi:hypothetical protein